MVGHSASHTKHSAMVLHFCVAAKIGPPPPEANKADSQRIASRAPAALAIACSSSTSSNDNNSNNQTKRWKGSYTKTDLSMPRAVQHSFDEAVIIMTAHSTNLSRERAFASKRSEDRLRNYD